MTLLQCGRPKEIVTKQILNLNSRFTNQVDDNNKTIRYDVGLIAIAKELNYAHFRCVDCIVGRECDAGLGSRCGQSTAA